MAGRLKGHSGQWHRARAGVITASMFSTARERLKTGANKGNYSTKAKDYAFRLAIERISGQPLDEGFETWSIARGHELEAAASVAHEMAAGLVIEHAGFVLTDNSLFGASADALINDDGGSEYKCFVSPEKLRNILLEDDWSTLADQVQGCLWITGRKWWNQCLYCPGLEPVGKHFTRLRVERDDNHIEAMETKLMQFARLVSQYEDILLKKAAKKLSTTRFPVRSHVDFRGVINDRAAMGRRH
ncbi:YqaJ viral recombinase family protein [Alcaligenaceae bacterium B3P038]|nr:YqaJ viral recombinase family protein [Alcaligenaceae bacterium B3P038]